jgi:uncharacterized protein (TIGR03067 family)
MKKLCALWLVALCGLVFNQQVWADDLKAMEGKWTIEKAEANGEAIDPEALKDVVVTITGDRYELLVKDTKDAGTIKLDEAQKPKAMDGTDTEGDDIGKVTKAIYELSGDTLRVCYAMEGGERPKEFATKPDSRLLLVTYKRAK